MSPMGIFVSIRKSVSVKLNRIIRTPNSWNPSEMKNLSAL